MTHACSHCQPTTDGAHSVTCPYNEALNPQHSIPSSQPIAFGAVPTATYEQVERIASALERIATQLELNNDGRGLSTLAEHVEKMQLDKANLVKQWRGRAALQLEQSECTMAEQGGRDISYGVAAGATQCADELENL